MLDIFYRILDVKKCSKCLVLLCTLRSEEYAQGYACLAKEMFYSKEVLSVTTKCRLLGRREYQESERQVKHIKHNQALKGFVFLRSLKNPIAQCSGEYYKSLYTI